MTTLQCIQCYILFLYPTACLLLYIYRAFSSVWYNHSLTDGFKRNEPNSSRICGAGLFDWCIRIGRFQCVSAVSLTGAPKYRRWEVEQEADHSPNIKRQNETIFFPPNDYFFLYFLRKLKMFTGGVSRATLWLLLPSFRKSNAMAPAIFLTLR